MISFEEYQVKVSPYKEAISKDEGLKLIDSLFRQFYKEFQTIVERTPESLALRSVTDIIAKLEILMKSSSYYVSFLMLCRR